LARRIELQSIGGITRFRRGSAAMRFSIVVVTWQSAEDLTRLVDSINRHLDGTQELIVVDNASTDGPLAAARGWRGMGSFLQLESNQGFGAAANAGVAAASHEAVAILNADVELVDDGLTRLTEAALNMNAIVGPRVLNPDGTLQPSASGPPIGIWPWIRAVAPSPVGSEWVLRRTAPWRLEKLTRVAWLTGCALAGPRRVLEELGPFDAAIHLYGEDLDLGVRASNRGVPSYFAPETCRIIHRGKGSSALRFADLGRAEAAKHARAVLHRAYGRRAEHLSWIAERLGLRLRTTAKRLLRQDSSWDATVLTAARHARAHEPLPSRPQTLRPPTVRTIPLDQ
jgi:N-acetylglucosaminyl-diphospho-decaprenol L-rhamnosyltransferase